MHARWLIITLGTLAGVFTPLQYQVLSALALLIGYAACKTMRRPQYQDFLAHLYGGLASGAGLQILIGFAILQAYVPMVLIPVITWILARALFIFVQGRYALAHQTNIGPDTKTGQGVSAWNKHSNGAARHPNADGSLMRWEFYGTGEIAMDGPTYGDAIFSNGCAFQGVGPSIALSDDGGYAAMPQPSQGNWGLLIVNLQTRQAYRFRQESPFWEIDAIRDGAIHGRCSPLTSNHPSQLSLETTLAYSEELTLVEDDGYWLIDHQERKHLPKYEAITILSSGGHHQVRFVPALKFCEHNCFQRQADLDYNIQVDGQLLDFSTRKPEVTWVDGPWQEKTDAQEGRFLVVAGRILDFLSTDGKFTPTHYRTLPLGSCDESTPIEITACRDAGDSCLTVEGIVTPRHTDAVQAESTVASTILPWDEEAVAYWGADGKPCRQARSQIQRQLRYCVNLPEYSSVRALPLATVTELINRSQPANRATLTYRPGSFNENMPYAHYRCVTSCGVDPGPIIQESIWSRCGRYLAVVAAIHRPSLPTKIRIIDFATQSLRELEGHYPLPSFIWFDENMLEFTYLTGLVENLSGASGKQERNIIRIDHPDYRDKLFDLLITSLPARRAMVQKKVETGSAQGVYTSGTVHQLAQHCILFGPGFDKAILQPPAN